MHEAEVVIVGGGIVGLATAQRSAARHPGRRAIALEKEHELAAHQTGHNSGVIHSGIYYNQGSLKADNCRRGKRMLEAFCREHALPFEICGKVIAAVDAARLRELEPHVAGVRATHGPETGIVDYPAVRAKLGGANRPARIVPLRGECYELETPGRMRCKNDERILNLRTAPSPAATSSPSIGETIVDHLAEYFR